MANEKMIKGARILLECLSRLGIKDIAICSDGRVFKNINKTIKIKKLKKKLKREQRKMSRSIEYSKSEKIRLKELKNFKKYIKL